MPGQLVVVLHFRNAGPVLSMHVVKAHPYALLVPVPETMTLVQLPFEIYEYGLHGQRFLEEKYILAAYGAHILQKARELSIAERGVVE